MPPCQGNLANRRYVCVFESFLLEEVKELEMHPIIIQCSPFSGQNQIQRWNSETIRQNTTGDQT
jgi:hypothetical protein